jgi:hypothetical protein
MDHSANFARFVNHQLVPPVTITTLEKDPYETVGLRMHFYARRDVEVRQLNVPQLKQQGDFLFFNRRYQLPEAMQAMDCKLLYSSLADWLGSFNVNGWLDRSEVWRLYRCSN